MKIRWGVIGCGGIADRRTLPGMMLSDKCELVAVMDANKEAAEKCKDKYGAKYAFDKFEDVLAIPEIDAVYIASPVFAHKEQAIAAAKAKKHILLEKPVALTTAEGEEIKKVCEAENVKIGIAFLMRYHNHHKKMKEILSMGKIGDIVSIRGHFAGWYCDVKGAWRQNKALSGGGTLMDMGVHAIDVVRHITGLNPVELAAYNQTQTFSYEVDDSSNIIMKMDNGCVAYFDTHFNIPNDATVSKLEIYGTKGSLIAYNTLGQLELGTLTVLSRDKVLEHDPLHAHVDFDSEVYEASPDENMYTKELDDMCMAIINDTDAPVSIEDAIFVQKIVEAAYKSSEEKKFVTIG